METKLEEETGWLARFFPPKERKVALGVRLQASAPASTDARGNAARVSVTTLMDVQATGKSVPVHLEVKDAKGKVVHEKTGTLDTFGFT